MPVRLFNLRGVPDDEAEDIRKLLNENHIDFYETSPGNWGISSPGIWLSTEEQQEKAKGLIDSYQDQRAIQQREIYQQLKQEGNHPTFWSRFREEPIKFIAYLGIIAFILYFSIKPFLSLGLR